MGLRRTGLRGTGIFVAWGLVAWGGRQAEKQQSQLPSSSEKVSELLPVPGLPTFCRKIHGDRISVFKLLPRGHAVFRILRLREFRQGQVSKPRGQPFNYCEYLLWRRLRA